MPLTDTRIKAAKPTDKVYKIYDAEGLYIEVPPTGSKRWRFWRLCVHEERNVTDRLLFYRRTYSSMA